MVNITDNEIIENSPLNYGKKEVVPDFHRDLSREILEFLGKVPKFVIGIDGIRRVGKTTLMKQILNIFCDDGKKVSYYSFDIKSYQTPENLEKVIKYFVSISGISVVCLDEIGKIDDWAGIIKKYYDRNNITFIISDSTSLSIKKGKESLAGRILNFTLQPLSFGEYLELTGIKKEKLKLNLLNPVCREFFKPKLEKFLIKGSYPELAFIDDEKMIKNYVKNSTIDKIIFDDIPEIFNVRHRSKLMDLFNYISYYTSDIIQEKSLSKLLGISEPTVSDYINYLEESHLVKRIFTESNFSKSLRKIKKIFVETSSIYYNTSRDISIGKLNETAVYDKIRNFKPLTFRDNFKREVDFIINADKKNKIAIEVKSTDTVIQVHLNNLIYYLKNNKNAVGIVLYNGLYDLKIIDNIKIFFVPLSTFLSSDLIFG
jgi:predicted AAA+ superfamily ATPase